MSAKKQTEISHEGFLSYEQLAAITNLKPSFLKKAKDKYGLPSHKLGSLVRFKLSDFEKWAAERRNEAS